jgi:hypothetical protein
MMRLRSLFPSYRPLFSSASGSVVDFVVLIVFVVSALVVCVTLWYHHYHLDTITTPTVPAAPETFLSTPASSTSAKSSAQTPPTFQVGSSVHIRYGQEFCFYEGTIKRLHLNPITKQPYLKPTAANYNPTATVVVEYSGGHTGSPNGGAFYEQIPLGEVYAYPGNSAARQNCRVFLHEDADELTGMWEQQTNSDYIQETRDVSGANDVQMALMCRPASLVNTNPVAKLPVPPAKTPPVQPTLKKGAVRSTASLTSTQKQRLSKPSANKPSANKPSANKPSANKPSANTTKEANTQRETKERQPATSNPKAASTTQQTPTRASGSPENIIFVCGRDAHEVDTKNGTTRTTHVNLKRSGVEGFVVGTSDRPEIPSSIGSATAANTTKATPDKGDLRGKQEERATRTASLTDSAKSIRTKTTQGAQELSDKVKEQSTLLAKRMSASMQVDATYVELLDSIMTMLWKNTYIDVSMRLVNPAPSVTSDTYHKPKKSAASSADRLYYNTGNGCVAPHMYDTSPQSATLGIHKHACSATTYELEYGSMGEVHMVGSNEGGYALLMFTQLINNMRSELRQVMGVEPGVIGGFVASVDMALFFYYPLRKFVRTQTLQKTLAAARGSAVGGRGGSRQQGETAPTPTAHLQTQLQHLSSALQDLVQAVGGKSNRSLEYLTPETSQLYKRPSNRMLPMFAVRAQHMSTHTANPSASQSPAAFCCEHDGVVSVGYGNSDCAAEISIAAYQNATLSRLMTGGRMSTSVDGMISTAFGEPIELNLVARDRVLLRELLGLFLGPFSVALLDQLRHQGETAANRGNGGGSNANTSTSTRSFMSVARQLLVETGVQLISLVMGIPPPDVIRNPSVLEWAQLGSSAADATKRNTAAWKVVAHLSKWDLPQQMQMSTITPNSGLSLPEMVSHVVVVEDAPPPDQPKRITVNLPWMYSVFGVQAAVGAAHQHSINVQIIADLSQPTRQSIQLEITRTRFPTGRNTSGPMRIYLTKRITVEQLTPQTWIPRMFLGHHTEYTSGDMASSLTHLPTYSISHQPITSMFDGNFYSGNVYRSRDGHCYSVKCDSVYDPAATAGQPNACCPGVTDVAACTPYITRMRKCTTGGGPGNVVPRKAPCHGATFDTSACAPAFRQMLQNVRNATLVLDTEAVPQLVEFLTDPSMAAVHIAVLNKTVKTLVLTTTLFHDLALELNEHTQTPRGVAAMTMPQLTTSYQDRIRKWKTTLEMLTTLYGVVAIVSPQAMCDTGGTLLSDIKNLRTTVHVTMEEHCKKCTPTTKPPEAPSCEQSTHKVKAVAYQMYKTLTLTFRRRFENSYNWSTYQTTLHDLQMINAQEAIYRANVSDYARRHHQTADFSSSPDIMHTIMSYSCSPEMVATIKGITWYGRDPIAKAADENDPLQVSLLPTCDSNV